MTYETLDWEAEALRVARAFGVEEECEFGFTSLGSKRRVLQANDGGVVVGGFKLLVMYMEKERLFLLQDKDGRFSGVMLDWNGKIGKLQWDSNSTRYSLELAKGLFHLDLLTPEVEAALQVSISTHQKLEWTLEYEAHYEL